MVSCRVDLVEIFWSYVEKKGIKRGEYDRKISLYCYICFTNSNEIAMSVPQFLQASYLRFFRGRTHGFTTRVHYPNSCKKHGSGRPQHRAVRPNCHSGRWKCGARSAMPGG